MVHGFAVVIAVYTACNLQSQCYDSRTDNKEKMEHSQRGDLSAHATDADHAVVVLILWNACNTYGSLKGGMIVTVMIVIYYA